MPSTSPLLDTWNADAYHSVMAMQQLVFAAPLVEIMATVHQSVVIDAGCGSGLIAAKIAENAPQAHIVALDISESMLRVARLNLRHLQKSRCSFVHADLQDYRHPEPVTGFFSNAAMHWVHHHGVMFANIAASMVPKGLLAVQMAWFGPHNQALVNIMQTVFVAANIAFVASAPRRVTVERERQALLNNGFEDIDIACCEHVFQFRNSIEQRTFYADVVLKDYLSALPHRHHRQMLLDRVLDYVSKETGSNRQCYESLRVLASKA